MIRAETLVSPWQFITLGIILIAWIALIVGRYDRRTIIRSGIGATVLLYLIVGFPLAIILSE
ncbi:hypothetical protein [Paenibacillus daejeonensis]|uniref:hypothetical protein n=1 Tax=Paenibacillus daejeonensis TaxID=135193 RepID=UPI0003684AB4|nr:hypothetical protein [Paenibacillus daejeonensis]